MSSKKGISLVSLVITIIVIIILAAIVIFNGFETTESAEFAKFAQEFSGYQEEIDQRYLTTKTQSVLDGRRKKDSAIYSEMGSPAGTVLEVLNGMELQEPLKGTNCYLLTLDREIYDENEEIYVTDKGEVFTLPGYEYESNGETRWYVNSSKYYTGNPGENTSEESGPIIAISGEVKIGDYVEYEPDFAKYTNNEVPNGKLRGDYYLGHNRSGEIMTDMNVRWRVVRIEDSGKILITPESSVNGLELKGGPGYLNSVRVLDYVCNKLYSNSTLGTKARSMRPEDLDYKVGWDSHCVYYLKLPDDNSSPNSVTVDGVTYSGWFHTNNEIDSDIMFWNYDRGPSGEYIKDIELNGYTYRYASPTVNQPVFISNESLIPGEKTELAQNVIGSSSSWLAEVSTFLDPTSVDFAVYALHNTTFIGLSLSKVSIVTTCSSPWGFSWSDDTLGVRPVVTLGSGLQIEANTNQLPGSQSNPWIITKSN